MVLILREKTVDTRQFQNIEIVGAMKFRCDTGIVVGFRVVLLQLEECQTNKQSIMLLRIQLFSSSLITHLLSTNAALESFGRTKRRLVGVRTRFDLWWKQRSMEQSTYRNSQFGERSHSDRKRNLDSLDDRCDNSVRVMKAINDRRRSLLFTIVSIKGLADFRRTPPSRKMRT